MTDDAAITDDAVLELLSNALVALPYAADPTDAPPAAVLDGALWVHDWLNMEADLAELASDSTDSLQLVGARSMGSLRELTFVSEGKSITLTIEPGPGTVTVTGSIEPPVTGTMQLVVGGEIFAGTISPDGHFTVEGVARGTVLAFVDTGQHKIRLGAFEI